MSQLLDSIRLLRQCSSDVDDRFGKRVVSYFGVEYKRLVQEDKLAFITAALNGTVLSYRDLKDLFGRSSKGTLANWRKSGNMPLEQFLLLQATLGSKLRFPSQLDRVARAKMKTLEYVHCDELKLMAKRSLTRLSFDFIEQALAEDPELLELERDREDQAWGKAVFRLASAVVDVDKNDEGPLLEFVLEWAPAYFKMNNALYWYVK